MRRLLIVMALAGACADHRTPPESSRERFAHTVDSLLLDSTLYEIRAQLMVKIPNPNRDDESPLADSPLVHLADPGPHTLNGMLYADVESLRTLLGRDLRVEVDTAREHVYVGTNPEVLLIGHRHAGTMFVPVKLFARQYGAFVDVRCTLANCGVIWPRSVLDYMKRNNAIGGTGMLEGHAEGLVTGIDVRKRPTG